jgi:heavy metal efflux system protein
VQRPLAVVVVSGLFTSTLLTLLLLPVVYRWAKGGTPLGSRALSSRTS